jgi:hypothetical protein
MYHDKGNTEYKSIIGGVEFGSENEFNIKKKAEPNKLKDYEPHRVGQERHNPKGFIRKLAIGDRAGTDFFRINEEETPLHNHKFVHSHYSGASFNDKNPGYFGSYLHGQIGEVRPKPYGDLSNDTLDGGEYRMFVSDPVAHGTANDKDWTDNDRKIQHHAGFSPPFYTVVYLIKVNSVNAVNIVSS